MAGIAPSLSPSIMAGVTASSTAAGAMAAASGLAHPASAGQATTGYADVPAIAMPSHPFVMCRVSPAQRFAQTAAAYAPFVGVGTALAAALFFRDWSGLGFLAMAVPVPTLVIPGSDGISTDAPAADGPPPLPLSTGGPSAAATQDTPPGGGAVVDHVALKFHSATTLPVTDAARAAVLAAAQGGAVLTPRGQMGPLIDHAVFTDMVTGFATAARDAVDGQRPAAPHLAPALTPMPAQLFKDGGGVVSYSTITTPQGPRPLATVTCGKTTGKYRFAITNNGGANHSNGTDWVSLSDSEVRINQGWVDIDLDQRRVIVSAKNGRTFAPLSAGERPTPVRNNTQRVVTMGDASSVRLQFGNSFVDVVVPLDPSGIIDDFRGRFGAAQGGSFWSMLLTPTIDVVQGRVSIQMKSGPRQVTLWMPPSIDPATSIELIKTVLSRIQLDPTATGHSTPLQMDIVWSNPKEFDGVLATLDDPVAQHLAQVSGVMHLTEGNRVQIILPAQFALTPAIPFTGPVRPVDAESNTDTLSSIMLARAALAEDAKTAQKIPLEVRQLAVALDYAWEALGRNSSLITPPSRPPSE